MTFLYKSLYIVSAFVPVHLVAAIAFFDSQRMHSGWGAFALVILGLFATVVLIYQFSSRHTGDLFKGNSIESLDEEVFPFLAVFLPFIFGVNFSDFEPFISALIFYSISVLVFVRMQGLVPNTFLLLLGWRVYSAWVETTEGPKRILIVSSQQPMIDASNIELARIGSSEVYVHVGY